MSLRGVKPVKIVVIGDKGVGKTSLIMTFLSGTFPTGTTPSPLLRLFHHLLHHHLFVHLLLHLQLVHHHLLLLLHNLLPLLFFLSIFCHHLLSPHRPRSEYKGSTYNTYENKCFKEVEERGVISIEIVDTIGQEDYTGERAMVS